LLDLSGWSHFAMVQPLAVDSCKTALFPPLLGGGTLHLLSRERALDAKALADIDVLKIAPSHFAALAALESAPLPRKRLVLGGEASRDEWTQALARNVRVLNHYGPTETTVAMLTCRVEPGLGTGPSLTTPLGRPHADARVYLLDRSFQPVPLGVTGEIWVGGPGVSRGYLDRPDLTAERFLPDLFAAEPGSRLYRTGDLARYLADGRLEFLGRTDHQVKIRGFRIELGEITAELCRHPGVHDGLVTMWDGSLVGYVVPREEAPAPESLRLFLRDRLPEYMVPAAFVVLDALPRTGQGKVDRKALPPPVLEPGAVRTAPRTPVEEALAEIWSTVLRRDQVGVEDDFFDLGGHSLLAVQLVSRVREAFDVELPVRTLFERPTIADLAAALEREGVTRRLPSLEALPRDRPLRLSFAQERLWFLHQMDPASPAYHMPATVRLAGLLERPALAAAFAEVERRHEALRTTFRVHAGEPVQVVAPPAARPLSCVDLQGLPPAPRAAEADRLAAAEARRPFDLVHGPLGGPLWRTALLALAPAEHAVLVTFHHILSDGWSIGVLVGELGPLYGAFATGRPSPLPPLAVQYADYAAWQRQVLSGDHLAAELAWWREQLAGAPEAIELPTARPRPAVLSSRGAVQTLAFEADLNGLARRHGSTLFMTLLAGFAVLLARHSGQDDLVVGTPVAGRSRPEVEPLIGLFVNTLALRVGLHGDPEFSAVLRRVRETMLAAYAHQELPFERLVEELVPRRDLSRPPLLQVVLALQNTPADPLALPGIELSVAPVTTGTAKFELVVALRETERGLAGTLEYSLDLFEPVTAARLASHFARLLAAAAAHPERRLSELALLGEQERSQVLREWNDTGKHCPQVPLVHELFAAHARLRPASVAMAGPQGVLTYGELEARANRLAWTLCRLGVGPEVLVAICTERTLERAVGIVAVLKAGGAYVSLDPAYPKDRLTFLLEDAGAPVLLTQRRFVDVLPETGAMVLCLDDGWDDFDAMDPEAQAPPVSGVTPENLSYVVYTSGSTGKPKGVEIPHAGLMNLVRWHQDLYRVHWTDRGTQIASPAFDASIWELWPYLAAGASLHIPDEETRLSSPGMIRWWAEQGITLAYLMTPLAEGVLEEKIPPELHLEVRALIIGGDRLHRGPDPDVCFRLMNHYGPAEYTVTSTVVQVPPEGQASGIPTIGRAVDNTQIYILGRRLELVPSRVSGELFVAGIGIARGYLRRPDMTAEKFIPNPWSEEPGARMYRTGDLVRWMQDGDIDFLGRLDHQVKLRGLRIELGEIESVLGQHPAVREAAVLLREDQPGVKRLTAYLSLHRDERTDAEDMRGFLGERLPAYMVPSNFVFLEALPLSSNGKVDRRALPKPEEAGAGETYVAPRTPAEARLAGLFAEVLKLDRVGIEDSFFELGGHSLLATQLTARVRDAFQVELPLRELFERPTVAALAPAVEREAAALLPPLAPVPRDRPLRPSFAQERLWFLDQLEPGGASYNVPGAVRMTGRLDLPALAGAFAGLVRRHEALRTTFAAFEGRPVQVIAPATDAYLPVVDLTGIGDADSEVRRLAVEEAGASFDLERGPLVRTKILALGESEHVLLFTLHHAISDGWSMAVMVQEIAALYGGGSLPELPVQYADYAVWQREWLSGEALEQQLAYWRGKLSGLPPALELPIDRPRPAVRSERGATLAVALPADLAARLADLSRRSAATLFMTLLAAFQSLLARATGEEDIPVGSVIANRTRPELEGVIGFFANTLVLRGDLAADPRFDELLGRTRETLLEAYAHQDLPFEKLVEELRPERSLAHSPLFQVMLVLQNVPRQPIALPGLILEPVELAGTPAKFDLRLLLEETPDGLAGVLGYSLDLFDEPTLRRLLGHFESLLRALAADPGVQLSHLPLLDEAERHQLLVEWNDTAGFREDACLQDLFETQAARTPDGIAVVFEEESLSFGELDRRSARLARHLARRGVGPESRVAICIERSPEMVVGLLGILRAGAAYVPLDPAHPHERRAAILEDLGPGTVLLTRQDVDVPDRRTKLRRATPDNAAYVIYTSGSTGKPKGVVVEHRQIVGYLRGVEPLLDLSGWSHFAMVQPLAVDSCKTALFPTLLGGGTLHLISKERALDGRSLADIDVLKIAPSHFAALEGAPLPRQRLVLGGEASRAEWTQALAQGVRVLNHYGPTETTVAMLTCRVEPGFGTGPSLTTPLGRPHAGARVYLLDRAFQPVPLGVTGEIWIGGPGVSRGYLDRPDLTAERFLPDPFEPGARLYRTGDLARYLADGRLEFLGRTDHQVKIRGFRIELGEITAELCRHPGVHDGLVTMWNGGLVGYVVPRDQTPTTDSLRHFLRDRLPEYMVPAAFVVLDALPRTGQGKVDRKALPPPVLESRETRTAPRTPVEEILAGLFAEVLQLDRIGVEESFFELGGHSLLATQLVSRVRAVFDVDLPVRAVFESPDVAGLAAEVEALRETGAAPDQPPLARADREGPLPLSFAQQRLWFLDRLEPGSPVYNVPARLRLTGGLPVSLLERIFAEVVRRHEGLRTTFAARDGRPEQVVGEPCLELPVVDLSGLPDEEALRLAREEARRPFDLERGPLLRLTLLRLGASDHLLLMTMHHIVSDGWSVGVLVREVGALYEAFSQGLASPLPELAVQYADYAAWQRSWMQGEALEARLAYWRHQLADTPKLLELPLDRPRPVVQTYRGAARRVALPPRLSEAVRGLSRRAGATPFMVLLAAWATLLGRHAGQEDVLLGTPIAGRTRREVEDLIGFFVNTLVLRADLSGSPGFLEQVRRVRQTALDAYRHQEVPFERLVEELVPERDLAHSPLFQAMFALQNAPRGVLSLPGLTLTSLATDGGAAKFDLTLTLEEREEGVFAGALEYNTDLFDGSTAARLWTRFTALLEGDPEVPVQEILTPAERHQAVAEWNDTARPYLPGVCLHELVSRQAPDAVALVFADQQLTYGELERRANRLAHHLIGRGVEPDGRVGVQMERSVEMIVALLGILKAGAAYVPLDSSHPAERRALLVASSGARVVLTPESLEVGAQQDTPPVVRSGDGNLAYVLFTSGSTGTPKGVMVPHRGVVNRLLWAQEVYRLGPADAVLLKAPFSFDFSVWEMFAPLLAGARLVVAEPGGHRDAAYLARAIAEHGVTIVHFVPSMLGVFLEEPGLERCVSLRQVFSGGEALTPALRDRYLERLSVPLDNQYGPTEISIDTTRWVCCPGPVSLGYPIANARLYVTDRQLRPQPPGVAGELLIGGAGPARGYLGRPDLTAAAFVPDPFGESGARVYRTGDLVRQLPDGGLEFLGRIDHQVKIRGVRIELGEVETALAGLPGVRECVVLAREGRLVAYTTGDLPETAELRAALAVRLPDYMVPAAFVRLDVLPLTTSGKVDRKALARIEPERETTVEARPQSPVEELVAGIFSEVLGVDRVGAGEDFFALGGHSLLATQVTARVHALFGIDLPVRTVFEAPTVAALAAEVEARRGGSPERPPLVKADRQGPLPLSFAQERLWFIDQLEPGDASYNIPLAVKLTGRLDVPALAAALTGIVRRHESLRTRFGSEPFQTVEPAGPLALPVVDLSGRPEEALHLAAEEARRPFDLRRGPLLRATLIVLAGDEHLALLTMHHIVGDAWSTGVLVRELGALYQASPLPDLAVQYADFALWQRQWLSGETLERQLAWWRERLSGALTLELPADRPQPPVRTARGGRFDVRLPRRLSEDLSALARRWGATPFMTLLAAFQTLLARYAGQPEVSTGTPVAGRSHLHTESLIGFFVNTLVLRTELGDDPGFAALVRRVRETALDAYAHQDLPFEKLVEELSPRRNLSRTPLFQVMFALQNAPAGALELPGLTLDVLHVDPGTAKFDLALGFRESPEGLAGEAVYRRDLFDGVTVQRLMACFETLLAGALSSPETPLSALPLMGPGETHQALVEWNDTPRPTPAVCVHKLVEAQVKIRPDATALVSRGMALSYGELDTRANQLARYLKSLGVGPEAVVAVCLDRSIDEAVAQLAVLKAGGAYLPLDPTHPAERLARTVEESGARVLVNPEFLGRNQAKIARRSRAAFRSGVSPANLAYVIYTSGSTGIPKGVEVEHRGLFQLVSWHLRAFGVTPEERASRLSGPAFDASVWELWPYLAAGASVYLPDAETRISPDLLGEWLDAEGIGHAFLPTPMAETLLASDWPRTTPLRLLLTGGDKLHQAPESPLPFRLVNNYGPTENTVVATSGTVPAGTPSERAPSIGRPIDGVRAYVLDRHLQPVPPGAPGELCLAGGSLSRGYRHSPELTAEKLVPDVFGARLYRTGDLARFLASGEIEFLGRVDHQVKVRGFRIELGEIETVLLSCSGVREAAVLTRDGRLVAFTAGEADAAALRGFLRERLPDYMVPAAFKALPSLPLTANGKVDRRALAAIPMEEERAVQAPRTPAEELLAGLFADVLGLDRVGIEDSFFDLGGHSLLATRLTARVRDAFGIELPLRDLFERPTVAALAPALERTQIRQMPPLRRAPRDRPPRLSFSQERLWFLDQLDPGNPVYNLPVALRIAGALDVAVLRESLAAIVERHEALRTTYAAVAGSPVQVIAPALSLVLPVVDLGGLPADRREPETARLVRAEARRPFDLARGPLLRLSLLRQGDGGHLLLFLLHHVSADGWSIALLIDEVAELYEARRAGRPAVLPELPVQFADFAEWQRDWMSGAVLQERLAYWSRCLAGAPDLLELPLDRPRQALQGRHGRILTLRFSETLTAALRALCRARGTTLFMTLLAGFDALLARYSGQQDVLVGSPIAGRDLAETERLIGLFVNTLVLRLDLSGNPTGAELLGRAREATLDAFAHSDLPFEQLVAALQPDRDLSHSPLFQVLFTLQNIPAATRQLAGVTISGYSVPTGTAKFDLMLTVPDAGDAFRAHLEYNSDLFDDATVVRLFGHLEELLAAFTADCERPVAELPLLAQAERHQLLAEWNDTHGPFPETTLLHQFFEAAMVRTPEAVAAVCAGRELTYAGLEERSNQLARLLRETGVGRGTPVGVWVERSLDMLIAVLGVLKAGGHYVALDDAWPADRVESILAATGSPAIVAGPSLLGAVEEMRWRLPALSDAVCLAVAGPEPPAEPVDPEGVRELWDLVAERAVDRVTAGGFVSAFTGEPMSGAEVDEYRDRVLSLAAPWLRPDARVLEIGNGSGLFLWEMAARTTHVTGVDPSPLTQERNREQAARQGIANVDLLTGFAHEIDGLLGEDERFDLVLLASTVQFFPGPRYLERVAQWALGRLAPGGALLIADVLDARRREELRQAIEERRPGTAAFGGGRRQELYLDEDLFADLGAAVVHHRTEGFPNELRFRYDVLLTPDWEVERRKRLWTGWHVDRFPSGRLSVVAAPEDVAYVIHTSGSTGEPKGIVVQHRPAANLLDWINRTFEIGPADRGLFVTSLCFDLSVYDIFGLLAAGGTVHVATQEDLRDPDRLMGLLRAGGITLWDSAPAALVQLAPLFPAAPDTASRLRRVLLSGDWIPVTLPDRVRQSFPGARVMALGGATEATVWSNWFPVGVVDPAWPSIPYGRPIANARYHVLDGGFAPCPIGVAGDLYIGGDCLCAGYARRPDLTALAFLPDPFAGTPGARLYRTGDRARWRADGTLEHLGRLDFQVKIRGYRIELGEIEVALARHPGVREAVVLAREDEPGDKRLVAYVVPAADPAPAALAAASLRDALRQSLPEYMVPAAFVILAALPVTANGKLDRRALPAPEWSGDVEYAAPRTPLEEILAGIWASVLGVGQVGREDHFFELGGHSLLAMQMVSRVRESCGVDLPLRVVFEGPTLAELAAGIEELRAARHGGPERPPLVRVDRSQRSRPLPLSFAQERLWFLDQLEPGSASYNVPAALRLAGRLDVAALAGALAEIVRRHESLRTTFASVDGEPRQVIAPELPVALPALPAIDLTALPAEVREAEAGRLAAAEALRPFDLARGPLLRQSLLLLAGPAAAPRESLLLSTLHHVVTDAWSTGILVRELAALYPALAAGAAPGLPPLSVQYADFAVWQRSWLQGEVLRAYLDWWKQLLAGAPELISLPLDRPRPALQTWGGSQVAWSLPPGLSQRLNGLARRHGASLFMTLLTACELLLARSSGQDSVVVGSPIANRSQVETEPLIGFFVNTLALRLDLDGDPTFLELLARAREV
ncbi:MAG TPA: non-ribosomal peptide synthase/polyketide synthase, partial [Thermoanaerobaculia bacterium]|nr:non-ribosomal peptide synthase/polyketide synthase [Thermoanaerobaculia bacterium]